MTRLFIDYVVSVNRLNKSVPVKAVGKINVKKSSWVLVVDH